MSLALEIHETSSDGRRAPGESSGMEMEMIFCESTAGWGLYI